MKRKTCTVCRTQTTKQSDETNLYLIIVKAIVSFVSVGMTYLELLKRRDVIGRHALEDLVVDDGVDGRLLHPDALVE